MSARILVDGEPDSEALLVQKFRRQIRGGSMEFLFARDGPGLFRDSFVPNLP